MVKTEVTWNSAEVFKKQTFLVALPTKNAADRRIWFQCQLPLRFPKWITEFKFNRKIAQTALRINCAFCWNRTKCYLAPERDIKSLTRENTKVSSPSIVKIPHKTRQVPYPTTESYVVPLGLSHVCVARATDEKKNHHFASQLVSPTHILYTEKHQLLLY